jgi:16S rRNA (adenine1518-N6/adenine1519-N6)-dimethyltransferase
LPRKRLIGIETLPPYGFKPRKSLGQHFIIDLNLTRLIARSVGSLDEGSIIEIGPGSGGLTRALFLEGAKQVVAIEQDVRCIRILKGIADLKKLPLTIIEGNALKISLENITEAPRKIVANLPYNIATALLLKWLQEAHLYESMTLMFQKEVADRLIAKPNTKAYGRLSVIVQWRSHVRRLFDVSPNAFFPAPKVMSTVVQIVPNRKSFDRRDWKAIEMIVKSAFSQRRKMLRSSLKVLGEHYQDLLIQARIPEHLRAEDLTIDQYQHLARIWQEHNLS